MIQVDRLPMTFYWRSRNYGPIWCRFWDIA